MNSSTQPVSPFSCAPFIKEIGRGKEGARGLDRAQARELMAAILAGLVSPLELGAVLIALRVKGETIDELLGFLDALADQSVQTDGTAASVFQQLNDWSVQSGKPVVVIPSYNGARRKPNLTAMIAGLLAEKGFPVLVHGHADNAVGRVSTRSVMDQIQWPMAKAPVYLELAHWQPMLAELLNKRAVLGVRNVAHTLVKLLVPSQLKQTLAVCSYTHPEFWNLQRAVFCSLGQTALVLRGHEGEPVAAPYRVPRMDGVKAGQSWCLAEPESLMSEQPDPHPPIDATSTARQIEAWLTKSEVIPHGFVAQLQAIETLIASDTAAQS